MGAKTCPIHNWGRKSNSYLWLVCPTGHTEGTRTSNRWASLGFANMLYLSNGHMLWNIQQVIKMLYWSSASILSRTYHLLVFNFSEPDSTQDGHDRQQPAIFKFAMAAYILRNSSSIFLLTFPRAHLIDSYKNILGSSKQYLSKSNWIMLQQSMAGQNVPSSKKNPRKRFHLLKNVPL